MCGIIGYAGKRDTAEVLLDGLQKLEYRGYDSAGIALMQEEGIRVYKNQGKEVCFLCVALLVTQESAIPPRFCSTVCKNWNIGDTTLPASP